MYLFIGAHQADENVFSSQVKNKIFARRSRPVGPNESARFRDPRPLQSHAGFPRKSLVKRSNLVRHMWCINTLTPSNYCIRYAIRANAHVLCSLVNLLFSATGVPVPTYLLDSQSELVRFTSCRRVFVPDLWC